MAGLQDVVSVGNSVTRALGQIASALQNLAPVSTSTAFATSAIAAAGTTQATATPITSPQVVVTSVATGAGIILPAMNGNYRQFIFNRGANVLTVYPPSGARFEAQAVNVPATVAAGADGNFSCFGATQWYT